MSRSRTHCPIPPVPAEVYARMMADIVANVWNSCGSSDEAAKRLGMPLDTVLDWVRLYRSAGIVMKKLPREENRLEQLVKEVVRRAGRSR